MSNFLKLFETYDQIVFFDTETTGLDHNKNRIIELAALRVEKSADLPEGYKTTQTMDVFINLPDGEKVPDEIVKLTGITDATLEQDGYPERLAAEWFADAIRSGRTLLAAHNAQFDLLFVEAMLCRVYTSLVLPIIIQKCDYLDTLTVYKDRRAYPHKLANAIAAYGLEDKVENSHRAFDDVAALFEVFKAMDAERPDLDTYINRFGYNPKYGIYGREISGVRYCPQPFHEKIAPPELTLPAIEAKRRKR